MPSLAAAGKSSGGCDRPTVGRGRETAEEDVGEVIAASLRVGNKVHQATTQPGRGLFLVFPVKIAFVDIVKALGLTRALEADDVVFAFGQVGTQILFIELAH